MAEKSINIASWPCLSNGLHYNWLVDYAAFSAFGTFELSAEEWEKRDLIVNFKGNSELTTEIDHQQAVDKAIDLVSSFLKAVFSEKEGATNSLPTLSQLTLVCLPASTRKHTERRFRKFSEQALTAKARTIIKSMRASKDSGKAVMFYSCIIGSIPGQTATAIKVADTFVRSLRERLDQVFIINPAEYFEPGMDGDDLMFMWEQVQRSGLINIWRFQSMEDIEASFGLMGLKVPPVWSGKDATFSTGCTKEMRIALDMQRSHPELQIVGPGPEKFFRRGDYGVGKFFDATISNANQE